MIGASAEALVKRGAAATPTDRRRQWAEHGRAYPDGTTTQGSMIPRQADQTPHNGYGAHASSVTHRNLDHAGTAAPAQSFADDNALDHADTSSCTAAEISRPVLSRLGGDRCRAVGSRRVIRCGTMPDRGGGSRRGCFASTAGADMALRTLPPRKPSSHPRPAKLPTRATRRSERDPPIPAEVPRRLSFPTPPFPTPPERLYEQRPPRSAAPSDWSRRSSHDGTDRPGKDGRFDESLWVGRDSRIDTRASSDAESVTMLTDTATWQLVTFPAAPVHCRATHATGSRP
jgi:hypothetical protein